MVVYLFYCSEQDLYDAGQDMIRALEGQLTALQVVDEDDEDDVEDTKEVEDAVGEGDTAEEGGVPDGDDDDDADNEDRDDDDADDEDEDAEE